MPSTLSLYIGLLVLLVSPLALLLMVLLVRLFVLLALLVNLVVDLALMINHLATILETLLLLSCLVCIEQLLFPNIVIFHTISTILVFQHLLPRLSIQATNLILSLNLWCWMD